VRLRVLTEANSLVAEVSDTGCGMTEAFVRDRLFRPFETTKPSGMGIGAYETAQYVREIGGRIEAQSKPGAGTRVRVMLPLHPERGAQDQQAREVA
jgi:signal transduction histidine kinase